MIHLNRIPIFLLLTLSLFGCIRYGEYRYGGEFFNAQLPVNGKKIGILEPRGQYGNAEAKKVMHQTLIKTLGKCPDTYIATEDGLNKRGELPPIYGEELSEDNLIFFVEKTTLDYLILLDVGPGRVAGGAVLPPLQSANQEVAAILTVYDLNQGGFFKEIIVNGALDYDPDLQIWETEASPQQMAMMAIRRAVKRLTRFSDCG
jgi:hypothetical protein